MKFTCPFSSIQYSISGISAQASQRLPHPILQSSYRTVYNQRRSLPLHLVLIRSMIETSLCTFEQALPNDQSLPDWQKLQCIDWINANLDFILQHNAELPHLHISNEVNCMNVHTWIDEMQTCITIIQHKDKSIKDAIYQASMPMGKMLELIRINDHASQRLIQRILQNARDTQTLLALCGLEHDKEFYLLRNLEPRICEALESKNWLLYNTLCGLREEQIKRENALHIPTLNADAPRQSLAELLKAKR